MGHRAIPKWVDAFHIEVVAYAGELQGRSQKRFFHTFASRVEIACCPISIHVPNRQVTIILIHKLCGKDVSIPNEITV